MPLPDTIFGEISVADFLSEYWRKKPLFVRNAWRDFISPLSAEDMFRLANRDDADSRLVLEKGGSYPWEALFGPFEEGDFADLPDSHWTLLIHEVERLVPEVCQLLDPFPFLPNWRFEDVMVSYATDQGGVGAHIDEYDVFLIQGTGTRTWQIGDEPVVDEVLVPDLDVRMLADFRPAEEWLAKPGDLLYLPPRYAHFGVAVGPCLTYSVGCRAPSESDLVAGFLEDYLSSHADRAPFSGNETARDSAQGMIQSSIKQFVRESLVGALDRPEILERWIGRFLSRPGRGNGPVAPDASLDGTGLDEHLRKGGRIRTSVPSQVMFDRFVNGELVLFAGGHDFDVPARLEPLVERLTGREGIGPDDAGALAEHADFAGTLVALINEGYFRLEKERA